MVALTGATFFVGQGVWEGAPNVSVPMLMGYSNHNQAPIASHR